MEKPASALGSRSQQDGGDFIAVSPPPSLSPKSLTVSVWVRYDSSEFAWRNNTILGQDYGEAEEGRRIIQLSTKNRSITWHRMSSGRDPHSLVPLEIGHWYHVVVTFDGGFHRLYILFGGVMPSRYSPVFNTSETQ